MMPTAKLAGGLSFSPPRRAANVKASLSTCHRGTGRVLGGGLHGVAQGDVLRHCAHRAAARRCTGGRAEAFTGRGALPAPLLLLLLPLIIGIMLIVGSMLIPAPTMQAPTPTVTVTMSRTYSLSPYTPDHHSGGCLGPARRAVLPRTDPAARYHPLLVTFISVRGDDDSGTSSGASRSSSSSTSPSPE